MIHLLVLALTMFFPASDTDWSRFRGPNGSGISETKGLPTEFGPDRNVLWKTDLPQGYSSPVIHGDRIFLTAQRLEKLLTLAVDRTTGKVLWERESPRVRTEKLDKRNRPAAASAATDGEHVTVFFGDYGLITYNVDGKELWKQPLGPFNNVYGMGASPLIVGDAVIMVCDQSTNSFIAAWDTKTGKALWKTPRTEAKSGHSTPILWTPRGGRPQIIVPGSFLLSAYDPADGKRLWWVGGLSFEMKSTPVVKGDVVYVNGFGSPENNPGSKIDVMTTEEAFKYDADKDGQLSREEAPSQHAKNYFSFMDLNGDKLWSREDWDYYKAAMESDNGMLAIQMGGSGDMTAKSVKWKYHRGIPQLPSPLIYENVLYMVNDGGGRVTLLHPDSGELLLQGRLPGESDTFYASPVAGDGKVYIASEKGQVFVLPPGPTLEPIVVNNLGDSIYATPALVDGRIYLRTLNTLYCFGTTAPAASSQRALQIEDYYRINTVGGTQIAPDGGWVLFTVATRLEDDPSAKRVNASTTQTFVVNTDGTAEPRLVQHDGRDVTAARWIDDSWVQYRVGTQTFKVRHGGEAPVPVQAQSRPNRPATGSDPDATAPGGRGAAPVPSPDGRWLAETKEKPRTKSEPQYASDFEKRHQDRFKGVIFDWKDFQRDGAPFPAPDPTAASALQLVVRPAAGDGDPKVLVDQDIRPANIAWHPDGRTLAFTADATFRDQLKYAKTDLWTVTLDGSVTQLTNDGYVYGDVDFSPDGKYLSYVRSFGTEMIIQQKLNHGGSRDIYIRPVSGGDPVNLTAKWDLDPGDTRWSADGRHLYFTAATGGETHLFRVSAPGGVVEQVTRGPRRIGSLTYDKGMTKIAYTVGLREAPPDVYVANIDGTGERRLSNVHAGTMAEIAFSKAERLQWPSNDGTTIEGFLMLPHGYDPAKGPYPMIVTSHGGPHSEVGYAFNVRDQYFAAHGYFVLDTNFRGSTGYGDAFKWATWGAWGDKDGQDVTSGIDYVLKRYPVDPKRVGHTGHSYGGFMTNWLITQYPDTFAAAIAGAGISNWISDYGTADIYRTKETEFFGPPWDADARERMIRQSPLTYAGRVKTPTLFVHGEVDQRVPYEEAEQMYFALRRRGVPAKMIRYDGQAHGISGHTNVVHRLINELAWFDKYLKPKPTPGTKN